MVVKVPFRWDTLASRSSGPGRWGSAYGIHLRDGGCRNRGMQNSPSPEFGLGKLSLTNELKSVDAVRGEYRVDAEAGPSPRLVADLVFATSATGPSAPPAAATQLACRAEGVVIRPLPLSTPAGRKQGPQRPVAGRRSSTKRPCWAVRHGAVLSPLTHPHYGGDPAPW